MNHTSELQRLGINLRGSISGQLKTYCPKCNPEELSRKGHDLSVNIDEGVYQCFSEKCRWRGTVKNFAPHKTYAKPHWINKTVMSDAWVNWFASRGISQGTITETKVSEGVEWMPQPNKEVPVVEFNYFKGTELLNIKYRDKDKNFKLVKDAELIFYNINALEAASSIIITEGEVDCLSYIEVGLKSVISIPNGASTGRMEYLDSAWDKFESIEKIYLATDNDAPGIALQKELARRIGVEKCYQVDFKDCKDANEYLVKHGKQELRDTIENAIPYPVEGIIYVATIQDSIRKMYRDGLKKGATIEAEGFDNHVSFEPGFMTTITGIPSHGKSEWMDFMATKLSLLHGWRFGVFSPENFPIERHFSKLSEKVIGRPFAGFDKMSENDMEDSMVYLNDSFYFIHSDCEYDIDLILEKARQLVLRYGIKALIIDPFNRLEHQFSGSSETHYISKLLDKIRNFNQRYGVHTFLIAHPTKIKKDLAGNYEVPTMYDISGSANFFNKTDIGMSVYRQGNEVQIHVQKVRFKNWGEQGLVCFKWNPNNGRFYQSIADNNKWI